MYAISGATGNTGRIIANTLLKAGKQVRVLGRDEAKLQESVKQGAEAAVGALEDSAFVDAAFKGAKAVYAMIPPNFVADDFRAYQKQVGDNLAASIAKNKVKFAVTLSSIGGDLDSGSGPVLALHWLEEALNRIDGLNVLHLRPTFFMENFLANVPLVKGMGIYGMPLPGDYKMTVIEVRDVGHYAAKRLLALDFSGKDHQDLLGERDLTMNEVTRAFGNAIGKPDLAYVQFSYEDTKQGMVAAGIRADLADLYLELYKGLADGRVKSSRPRDAESTTPTSIEEFSKIFAQVYNS